MKGIVVTTDNVVSVKDFGEPLYKTAGEAVGGYIEVVKPRGLGFPLLMLVNEEGKLMDLPVNIFGSSLYGSVQYGDPIVGDIVIMQEGIVDGEPDVVGLSDVDIERILARISKPLAEIRKAVGQE